MTMAILVMTVTVVTVVTVVTIMMPMPMTMTAPMVTAPICRSTTHYSFTIDTGDLEYTYSVNGFFGIIQSLP